MIKTLLTSLLTRFLNTELAPYLENRIKKLIKLNEESILLLILVLATFLRLWNIDKPTISQIELGFGTVAYAITNPIRMFYTIHSYTGPMLIYILIPLLLVWKNLLALRIVIAAISTITILLVFMFTKELYNTRVALFSSFVLAVNPTDIAMSRTIWEVSLIPFFIVLTLYIAQMYYRTKRAIYLYSLSFICGLGILTRLNFLFFLFSLLFSFCIYKLNKAISFFKEIGVRKLLLASILFILAIFPMILYNIDNDFNTIQIILGSYPETFGGMDLLEINKNIVIGIENLFQDFLNVNILHQNYYANLSYSTIFIFSLASLIIFDLFLIVGNISIKNHLKKIQFIKIVKKFIFKDVFLLSNLLILLLLSSTLTIKYFTSKNFIITLPFVVILMGRAYYEISNVLNNQKVLYFGFISSVMILLAYNGLYLLNYLFSI